MNTQTLAPAQTSSQLLLDVKKRLNIPDTEWKARLSEQLLYVGNFAIMQAGIIQWQGTAAVSRDGIYYKVRFMQGKQLRKDVDENFRAQSGLWWSKSHLYYGFVWSESLVATLKAGGAQNVRVIPELVARNEIPQNPGLVKTPMPVSTNMHMNGSKVDNVTVSDLPQGVTLNQQGRPVWDRSAGDKFGRFISNEDLASLRKQQGIVVTPSQQVSAPKKEAQATMKQTQVLGDAMSEYELGAYVGMMDEARDLGEQPYPDDSTEEWMAGYASVFAPEPEVKAVDPELLAMKDGMGALAAMMSEMMAKLEAKLNA